MSILLLGGSAGVCAAQAVEPTPPAAPPAEVAAPAEAPTAPAQPAPAEAAAPAAAPDPSEAPAPAAVTDPSAPLVAYSGSMTKVMTAATPAKAAFAMLGAAAMLAEGARIIEANNIVDPSQDIARDVAADLARTKAARLGAAPLAMERKGLPKPAVLAAAAPDAAYVVDVDSGWTTIYFPVEWTKFRVIFLSNVRVVDASSKAVAVKHTCNWTSDKQAGLTWSQSELLENGAKGLKDALVQAAAFCGGQFKAKIGEKLGGAGAATKAAGA